MLKIPVFDPECHVNLRDPLFIREFVGIEVEVRPDQGVPLEQPRPVVQSQRGYSFFKLAFFTSISSARTPDTPRK